MHPMLQPNSSTPQLLITNNFITGLITSSFKSVFRKMKSEDSSITINEPKTDSKGKSASAAPAVVSTTKATALRAKGGWKRGLAIFDFILRLVAIGAALAATATMGTTDQTLPFFTQFFQFHASYDDLPAFMFFVIANAIASGYLVLSLPFSIIGILRPQIAGARLPLLICDTVMVALTSAAATAATAIVYLAHNGNSTANWVAICQQFNDFCQQISGAVMASFLAALVLMLLVVVSALAIRKH